MRYAFPRDLGAGIVVTMILDSSVDAFLSHVGRTLMRQEAQNSLILGLCDDLRRGRYAKYPPILARVVDNDGGPLTAALQTPPHNLILTPCSDTNVWPLLASSLSDASVIAPGALGPHDEVVQFANAWREYTGHDYRLGRGSRVHQLDSVQWHAMPTGKMVIATAEHLALVRDWTTRFVHESIPDEVIPTAELLDDAERRVRESQTFLWMNGSDPACMAYHTGRTPNGIRISGVYTPAHRRGQGFATALVARLSQHLLDQGRLFCFLYTDTDNPTSNRIYRRIGYRSVGDCRHVLFET